MKSIKLKKEKNARDNEIFAVYSILRIKVQRIIH